jgi:hypothetical protein
MQSFKDNRQVADVEGISISMRCWKCEGSLRAERAIDLKPASQILVYVCVSWNLHKTGGYDEAHA